MKKVFICISIFLVSFFIYFATATNLTFHPKWALDYYNPFAQSLLDFRLDIQLPSTTYDLAYYSGKWYTTWGFLPALFLIPLQLIRHQYVPLIYLNVFFSSCNIVIFYSLLQRLKKEFLPDLSEKGVFVVLVLFAFGTAHYYVGTLGSVWHVDQMVTAFLQVLGIYIILKKKRKARDYLLSSLMFSVAFFGRPTMILFIFVPFTLYIADLFKINHLNFSIVMRVLMKGFILIGVPFFVCMGVFFGYNYLRFNDVFEFGFSHIHESPYLAEIRKENGAFSVKNLSTNFNYMVFELPGIEFNSGLDLHFNLKGNSIFFLTPPFLAIFLAWPIYKKGNKYLVNVYIFCLWVALLLVLLPNLLHYGSGWVQFGYRYSLDVIVPLVLLSVLGIKGRVGLIYTFFVIFAVVIHIIGIRSLM